MKKLNKFDYKIILVSFICNLIAVFVLKLLNSYNLLSYLFGILAFSVFYIICNRIEKR